MNYEKITPDGRLWSVIYPDESACALNNVFDNWGDPVRNDLIANDVIDKDSFVEFISEL